VAPRDVLAVASEDWAKDYLDRVGASFRALRQQISLQTGMNAEYILLQGDPAKELVAYAESANADLIATGSHGHGFLARHVLGSVSTRVLREARCGVLIVPFLAAAA
jgi:nucleotide-binding universal stress UspA family protein